MANQVVPELTPRHLRVLILTALSKAGLGHLRDAMGALLLGSTTRMLVGGTVDLTSLWLTLSQDSSLEPEQAHRALLLIFLYLDSYAHAKVTMPDEMRAALHTAAAMPQETLEQQVALLAQQVTAALGEQDVADPAPASSDRVVTQPAETRKPEPSKKQAPSPQGQTSQDSEAQSDRAHRRRIRRTAIAIVVLTGLLAFRLEAHRRYQAWQAFSTRTNQAALSRVVPVEKARISGDALVLVLADGSFTALSDAKKEEMGERLFTALDREEIQTIFLISGEGRYRLHRQGDEVTVTSRSMLASGPDANNGDNREK